MDNKWVFLVIGLVIGGIICSCLWIAVMGLAYMSAAPGVM